MKRLSLFLFFAFISLNAWSQIPIEDSIKKVNVIFNKENIQEAVWDNGVPILPEDEEVMDLIYQLDEQGIKDPDKLNNEQVRIYRELGIEFYNKGMYQEADFYLSKIKNYAEVKKVKLKEVFSDKSEVIRKQIHDELEEKYKEKITAINESKMSDSEKESAKKDAEFLKTIPRTFDNLSKDDLENLSKKIDGQIKKLTIERDDLIKNKGSQESIDSKDASIKGLKKDKSIIDLNIEKTKLKTESKGLRIEKETLKKWLIWAGIVLAILIMAILIMSQRKTIKVQDGEITKQLQDINKKNTYLEYAARIIRHDMHSGINTYMPRGLSSLQKRISQETINDLKIGPSLQMIKEGLAHTQKVYKNVYEFTNLVKVKADFKKEKINLKDSLQNYLSNTSYGDQVELSDLGEIDANEQLICNSIDNLIRNGLKYNKSENKLVKIYTVEDSIIIEDNGEGLSTDKFDELIKNGIDTESETGLGLSITKAIVEEHGFSISCENAIEGTKIKIKIK